MNVPKYLIIHCSDSEWGCAREVRKWHISRGWNDVGYHFLINNGYPEKGKKLLALMGSIECGRSIDSEGAHCLGYNEISLGICLIGDGTNTFCGEQYDSLKMLCQELCMKYGIPAENVLGHGETESGKSEGKTCPNFAVSDIRKYLKGRL